MNPGVSEVFERLGLEYLERNRYDLVGGRPSGVENTSYFRANEEEFRDLDLRYGKDLRAGYLAPLEIRGLGLDLGYGLFSGGRLARGDLVGQYTGVVQESAEFYTRDDQGHFATDYAWDYPDELPGYGDLEISAYRAGNELRFANHSFEPNLLVEHCVVDGEWVIFFVANMPVEAGDQLLVSYGDQYWDTDEREVVLLK